ncbi:hypothetical protein Rsub_00588 [Raphidocelis subcapitata]|uniref:Uncharacterized protein n=1 Tax=Raphidocelis subcapitata TaxID=307507 RepID=A0A2V0NKL8_9CHLO|nr:hypothetical protein Rsub_00588 [Raphidocelis subcapitata]|eukprot:GBF87876.1 hypothetical protein Rsub_00588 [Raphidocelis subcapitata]
MLRCAARTLARAAGGAPLPPATLTGPPAGEAALAAAASGVGGWARAVRPVTGLGSAWAAAGLAPGLRHRLLSSDAGGSSGSSSDKGGAGSSSSSSSSGSGGGGGEKSSGAQERGDGGAAPGPGPQQSHQQQNQQQQQQHQQRNEQLGGDEWEERARTRRVPPAAAAAASPQRPAASASDYGRWSRGEGGDAGNGKYPKRPGSRSEGADPEAATTSSSSGSGSGGGHRGARGGVGKAVGAAGGASVEWTMEAAAAAAASWTSRGGARGAGGPGGRGGGAGGEPCRVVQRSGGVETVVSVAGRGPADYRLELLRRNAAPDDAGGRGGDAPRGGRGSGPAPRRSNALQLAARRLNRQLQNTFLPSGYPGSVGPNYLSYSIWQAATNFATTANGVLASTFLLYSVGLGAGAIPTAGALNWVVKDGLGQLGTLLFGKAIAHNFDIHSKSWYFLSFALLSTATGMEIATILAPNAFLVLGSCANMIKGLSWMAGGSTRSVFNLSFVRDNNIADITAKNTSQYIFASLFGTAFGVSICAYIGQSAPLALACFSALTGFALYSSFRTVQAIPLPTLNSTRLQLLTARYLKCVRRANVGGGFGGGGGEALLGAGYAGTYINYQREYEVPDDEESACARELPTPLELAEQDPPLPWFMGDQRILNPEIRVGSSFDSMVGRNADLAVTLVTTFRYSRYLLLPTKGAIHLVLHHEAQPRDIVTAYLQACILRKRLKTGLPASPDNLPELRIILHDTMLTAEKLTGPLMEALSRQGWQTEKIVVEAHRRRALW